LSTAAPITIAIPQSGELNPANETDIYTFTANAGDRFFFDSTLPTAPSVHWRLVDSTGASVFGPVAMADSNGDITLPRSGTYFLFIEGQVAAQGVESYGFNLEFRGNVPVPPPTAFPLSLGMPVSGSVEPFVDEDRYSFTLASDARVILDVIRPGTDVTWTLQGPRGQVAARSLPFTDGAPAGFSSPVLDLVAGDYVITLSGRSGAAGYSFRLLDLAQATPIVLGPGRTPGQLSPGSSAAAFTFTAAAGRLVIDPQFSGGSNRVWRLLDRFDQVVATGSGFDDVTIASGGDYTLLVEGNPDAADITIGYNLLVRQADDISAALTLGQPASATIAGIGDRYVYDFTIAAPTRLYFDPQTPTPFVNDLRWTLTGPQGVVADRDFGEQFLSSSILQGMPVAAGDYQLVVYTAAPSTGTFQLALLDIQQAPTLTVGAGAIPSTINGAETQLYRISAAFGDLLTVNIPQIVSSGLTVARWKLLDPFGRSVGSLLSGTSSISLNRPGTYTLVVMGVAPSFTDELPYSVSLQLQGNFPPSGLPSGTPITLDSLVSGQVPTTAFQQINYRFSLAADTQVYFDAQSDLSPLYWLLTGPRGSEVSLRRFNVTDAFGDFAPPVLNLFAGDYALSVVANNDGTFATGPYQFRLIDLAQAPVLTTGASLAGQLNPGDATVAYRIAGTAGERLYVAFDAGDESVNVRMLDPLGRELVVSGGEFTLPFDGEYRLLLEGDYFNNLPIDYTLTVNRIVDDELELTLGATTNGNIDYLGQRDLYRFEVAAPTRVLFDGLTNGRRFWSLAGPRGFEVDEALFEGSEFAVDLVPGEYTLAVGGFDSEVGPYSFRLLDLSTATELTPGSPVAAALDPANEANVYQFDANAGDRFFFEVLSQSGGAAQWSLLDPYGRPVFGPTPLANVDVTTLEFTGTYSLLIAGDVGATGVTSYEIDVDPRGNVALPPLPQGTPLEFGSIVGGVGVVQPTHYRFTLTQETLVYFDARTDDSRLLWSLTGPAGTVVADRLFTASDSVDQTGNVAFLLRAGDYDIGIRTSDASTAFFNFALLNLDQGAVVTPGTTPISGSFAPRNATAFHRFQASAGNRFLIDVLSTSTTTGSFRLLDPTGRAVAGPTNSLAD
ncbi:MAG TPA: hypothetical protein VLI71_04755, partial [Gammaproteobacteria bacterium]|nr:hypothetical protein [Gammaproteobacteria bacterium]